MLHEMIVDVLVWLKVFAKRMKGEVLHIRRFSNKHHYNQPFLYFIMQQLIFLHVLVNPSFTTYDVPVVTGNNHL